MDLTIYVGFSELVKKFGIETAAEKAAAFGFTSVEFLEFADGVSFSPVFKSAEEAKKAKAVLKANGLSVACCSVGVNLVDISAEKPFIITDAIERLKFIADIAEALGSRYIHHTLVHTLKLPDNAPSYGEVLPLALKAAGAVADYCHPLGITVLYEEQGMYFNGLEGFGGFFSRMKEDHPNVGVCGDVGNIFFADETPIPLFERYAEDIRHVHVKDYFIRNELSEGEGCKYPSRNGKFLLRAPIGKGDIDISACFRILRSANYSGAFAIEDNYTEELSDTAKDLKTLISEFFA